VNNRDILKVVDLEESAGDAPVTDLDDLDRLAADC
jgi:hypothetical protein